MDGETRPPLGRRAAEARARVLEYLEAARAGRDAGHGRLDEAAELLYEPPPGKHFLRLEDEGWAVDHPPGCLELGDPKQDCVIHVSLEKWLALQNGPPLPSGRWLVEYDDREGKTRILRRAEEGEGTVDP